MTMTQLFIAFITAALSVPVVRGIALYILQHYFGVGRGEKEETAVKWIEGLIALPVFFGILLYFDHYFESQG